MILTRRALAISVLSFAATGSCLAALLADLPDLVLPFNQVSPSFQFFIQNDGAPVEVNGLTFSLQVADGGPEAGGTIDGPSIVSVDIVAGTAFSGNNTGNREIESTPQVVVRTTTTSSGTVSLANPNSLLATVVFDTTGIAPGIYTYTLDTLNGPLKYNTTSTDIFPTMGDGTLTVVPEPSTYAAVFGLACLGWAVVRKFHSPARSARA